MSTDTVTIGIIGCGLMGREAAIAFRRWSALVDHPVRPVLAAVCDTDPEALRWFADVPLVTTDYTELLADDRLDVVYVAVPHQLHEQIYLDVLDAGKDLFGEKPFGIDLPAARRIVEAAQHSGRFVRCSSEMPFFPGAQAACAYASSGALGRIIEADAAFLHSSDLNLHKPINWKRRVETCGEVGVMGDLGMHPLHVPLRLGWRPSTVHAVLQNLVHHRSDGKSGMVACDTFENATLHCGVDHPDGAFPLTIEMKRIAIGEMNTWRFRAAGMEGGIAFSTRNPQTVRRFRVSEAGEQIWDELQVGHTCVWPTITGGIFEFGFTDALLQMWSAYLAERAGELKDGFGCATPLEALSSHEIFDAALRSHEHGDNAKVRHADDVRA